MVHSKKELDIQSLVISKNTDGNEPDELIAKPLPTSSKETQTKQFIDGRCKDEFKLVRVKPDGTYATPSPPSPSRFTSDGTFKLKWPTYIPKNSYTSTDSNESSASAAPTAAQSSVNSNSPSIDKDDDDDMWKLVKVNADGSFGTPPQSPSMANRLSKKGILQWKWE